MSELVQPVWIDTAEGVAEAASECARAGRFALDTEADSLHSYFHKVCLIQVSANGLHMVIDPLALESVDLAPLWVVVGDPSIPILMHGADYDLRVLDRDYNARVRGLLDTQVMARILGEERTGLATLINREAGVQLDKRFQRADWGRRPLTADQLAYAAADTAYLGLLAGRLRAQLEEKGRWAWAEEECQRLEDVRHVPVESNPMAFERIKGARALRREMRDRVYSLHQWRDQQARALDLPPFKILGNKQLLELAQKPPSSLEELGEINGIGPRFVRRWGKVILGDLRRPKLAPKRVRGRREPTPEAAARKRYKRLAEVRDARATELKMEPGLLCPKSCVAAIAGHEPRCKTLEDLAAAGLEGWRLEVLGDSFLELIADEN